MNENTHQYINTQEDETGELSTTIKYYGSLLLHRWKIIAYLGLLVFLLSFLFSAFLVTPLYKASTTLYVYRNIDAVTNINSELSAGSNLAKDGLFFIKTDKVTQRALELLDLPESAKPSATELNNMITATAVEDTRILKITLSCPSQEYVAKYANAIAAASKEVTDNIVNSGATRKIDIINIIDEATKPSAPYTPNVAKNALIGLFVGIVLGVGIVLLQELLNDTFKNTEKLEAITGLEIIGTILTFE